MGNTGTLPVSTRDKKNIVIGPVLRETTISGNRRTQLQCNPMEQASTSKSLKKMGKYGPDNKILEFTLQETMDHVSMLLLKLTALFFPLLFRHGGV